MIEVYLFVGKSKVALVFHHVGSSILYCQFEFFLAKFFIRHFYYVCCLCVSVFAALCCEIKSI